MGNETITGAIDGHVQAAEALRPLVPTIEKIGERLSRAAQKGQHLFLCGNGGSAAEAQHWAGEWRGRFTKERRPLRATALTVDTSSITAIANDYGYDEVFARQLQALANRDDVLVAISTSGNSKNVLRAVQVAKSLGVYTVGLTGGTGGALTSQVDISLAVPSGSTPRIQECHQLIMHALCELVDASLA